MASCRLPCPFLQSSLHPAVLLIALCMAACRLSCPLLQSQAVHALMRVSLPQLQHQYGVAPLVLLLGALAKLVASPCPPTPPSLTQLHAQTGSPPPHLPGVAWDQRQLLKQHSGSYGAGLPGACTPEDGREHQQLLQVQLWGSALGVQPRRLPLPPAPRKKPKSQL